MSKCRKLCQILISSLVLIGLLSSVRVNVAEAHVLKEDNGISAVLHIPPEDNPQANKPTELDLSFGDERDVFSLQDCNCQVYIKHNDQILQSLTPKPALYGATLDGTVSYQFPAIGVYDVVVTGRAKDGLFKAFSFDYLVRVATSASNPNTSTGQGSEVLLIASGSLVILIMTAYTVIKQGGRYRQSSSIKRVHNKPRRNKR